MSCRNTDSSGMLVMGIMVTCIGTLLLFAQLGYLNWGQIWRWWPMFFVFAGVGRIISAPNSGDRAWGVGLITIGLLLEANVFGYIPWGMRQLWPLFIIAGGIALLWRAYDTRKALMEAGVEITDPDITMQSVFGTTERIVRSQNLRGGKLSAIFGEFKLDLTRAEIEGNTAVIHAEAVFGSGEIRVPPTWTVSVRGNSVFGTYEDKTYHAVQDATRPSKTLLITGSAVFGAVEIRN